MGFQLFYVVIRLFFQREKTFYAFFHTCSNKNTEGILDDDIGAAADDDTGSLVRDVADGIEGSQIHLLF